jgi:cell division transport system permease protein
LVAINSFQRLCASLVPTLMTWLVLGIALSLPGALYLTLENLARLGSDWEGAAQLSLFLNKSIDKKGGDQLAARLVQQPLVEGVRFITAEQALNEFQDLSGLGDVLSSLDSNPLPSVIIVKPVEEAQAAKIELLAAELLAWPEVDELALDLHWLQRLQSIMTVGHRITLALFCLLSLGVLLVIGNTIRLAIENRRDEILIVKLVGGTNAFVRRPFLYTGLWYGLGGGLFGWLILLLGMFWLEAPVRALADLYHSQFELGALGIAESIGLWFGAALLGLAGAWLAVARHLGSIEPQ